MAKRGPKPEQKKNKQQSKIMLLASSANQAESQTTNPSNLLIRVWFQH